MHVTYYIISSLFFGWNSSLSRLFQLVMSCHWHMNMCCPMKLNVDMLTLFKKLYVNAKGENGKILFAFSTWKQPWWSLSDTMHGTQYYLYLFSSFINHKFYKFVSFYNYVNVMWELYAQKARGRKCENILWICNDPMTMYFKLKRKNEGWPYNWRC